MDKLFCQALCRNRSIHYFFFSFEEPRWLTCGPKLLSLPNISHEALINKLNIRTLARKFVYFQIRKNNTYQVVFIGAQRSFHSLSLNCNVLAGEHLASNEVKHYFFFIQFHFRFFTLFIRNLCSTLPFKGWRSEIHLFLGETFTFRFFFSILIRPKPRSTYWIVLLELSQKLWVPHWAPVKFFFDGSFIIRF